LVAVDGTATSRQAVRYVGEIVGCAARLEVCLLHVYPAPPPDYRGKEDCPVDYRTAREAAAVRIFTEAIDLLVQHGVARNNIITLCRMAHDETISGTILHVRAAGGYGTVVVGKRGVSKAEEFLFGSISSAVSHGCSDFTVWIVG